MKLIKIFSSFIILLLSLSIVSAAVDISEPQQIFSENKELFADWGAWIGGVAVGVAVVGVCVGTALIGCGPAVAVGAAAVGAGVATGVTMDYANTNSDDPSDYVDSIDWPQTTSFTILGGIDDNGQALTQLYEGQKRSEWIEIVPIDDICKLSGSEQPLTIRNIDQGTWDAISWTFKLPCFHKHKENEDWNSYFMHEITKISNTDTEYFNCQIVHNENYPYHMTSKFIQYSTGTTSYTENDGKNLIDDDVVSKADQVQKPSYAKIMCEILQDVPEDVLGVRIDLENKFYSWDDGDNKWSPSSASQTFDGETFSLFVPYGHINDAPVVESFSVDATDVSGYTFKMSDFDNVFTDEEDETWSFIEIGPSLYGDLYLNGELLEFEEDNKKSNSRYDIEDSSNPDLTSLVFVPNEDFKSLELGSQGNLLSFALYDSEMLTVTDESEPVYYKISFEKLYEVPDYATDLEFPEIKVEEDTEEVGTDIKVLNLNTYLEETISEYSYLQTGSSHLIDPTHGDCLDNTNNKNYFSMKLDNFCELDEPIFNVFDQSNNEKICLDIVEVSAVNPEGGTTTSHNLIVRFNEHFNGEQELIVTCSDGQEYLGSGKLNIIVEPTTDPTIFSDGDQFVREGVETKIRIPGTNVDLNSQDNIRIYEPNTGNIVTQADGSPFFDEQGYYFNWTSGITTEEEGYSETIIYEVFDWDFETDQPDDQQYEITIDVSNALSAPTNEDFEINFYEDSISEFINEDKANIFESGILNNELIAFSEGDTDITRVKFTELPSKSNLLIKYDNGDQSTYEDVIKNKIYPFSEYPSSAYSFALSTPLNDYGMDYDSFDYMIGNERYFAEESATITINLININDQPVFTYVEDVDELLDFSNNFIPLEEFSDFYLNSNIDEDGMVNLKIGIEDYDNDELAIFAQTSRPDLILDEDILITGDSDKTISFNLPQDVSDIDFNLTVQIEEISNEDGDLITQNALSNSFTFEYHINPINDIPVGQNITYVDYVYSSLFVAEEDLNYTDADEGDLLESIKILTLPSKGTLRIYSADGNHSSIEAGDNIPRNKIQDLQFTLADGVSGSSIVRYQLFDGDDYSSTYEINFTLEPSPFGNNSQPASRGGFPIPNVEYGEWSCKFGYEPVPSSIDFGYTCQEIPNEPPIADFTIYPLTDNTSYLGQTLYLKSISTDPDATGLLNYNWSIDENGTKTIQLDDFDGEICTNGICTVTLKVSDGEDSSTITKRFLIELVDEAPLEEDYSKLIATEGKTYNDNELAALGLKKGDVTKKSTKSFEVDNQGKLVKITNLQARTASAEDYQISWIENDGTCDKFIGENSVNSPIDCEEKSNIFGIIIVFSFISILGILGFVAWKKGLFSKLGSSKKSIATPATYDAPSYTAPANNSAAPTSNFLSKMIKEKIDQGYSEGEIKSYLISKGYSESEIDNAINS